MRVSLSYDFCQIGVTILTLESTVASVTIFDQTRVTFKRQKGLCLLSAVRVGEGEC